MYIVKTTINIHLHSIIIMTFIAQTWVFIYRKLCTLCVIIHGDNIYKILAKNVHTKLEYESQTNFDAHCALKIYTTKNHRIKVTNKLLQISVIVGNFLRNLAFLFFTLVFKFQKN